MVTTEQIAESLSSFREVIGCAVLRPDRQIEPGWQVFTLANGSRVRVDFVAGTSQEIIDRVRAVVVNTTPQTLTPQQIARQRAKRLLRSTDPQSVLLRAILRAIFPGRPLTRLISDIDNEIELGGGDIT